MKYKLSLVALCILLCSHDMFLKLSTYFLEPDTQVEVLLYNGTIDRSDNTIARDRMMDVSLVANGTREQLSSDQWSDRDSTTVLSLKTGVAGTYVAGVSTRARNIEMEADRFNTYLKHDGVVDMLADRTAANILDQDAVERYSKHVKAIFQVGDTTSDDWKTELGYPIEFVPQVNPYELHTGDTIPVQLLLGGAPLANQLVLVEYRNAGNAHSHASTDHTHSSEENHSHDDGGEDHTHDSGVSLRTDADGMLNVDLTYDGIWFLRTIHMTTVDEPGLTHESNWATLTFEVTHDHGSDTHEHGYDTHTHDDGIPGWVFWVGSLVVLGGLFVFFNRKN